AKSAPSCQPSAPASLCPNRADPTRVALVRPWGTLVSRPLLALPGLCRIWPTGGMPKPLLAEGSDRQSQLVERGGNSKAYWLLDCQLVVPAANVMDEGVSGDRDPGAVVLFEPGHRPEPRLQPPVVAFDAVVGVLVGPMPRRRQQVIEHCRIPRCPVGGDIDRSGPGR